VFHGLNRNAFLNFYESQGIDLIYLPKEYKLKPHKNGFDPIPLIKKSKVEYREVAWTSKQDTTSKDELNHLFN
jgi:non-homologous end joining protein Ku